MRHAGLGLPEACDRVFQDLIALGGRGGCVAVDRSGRVVMPFATTVMFRGCIGNDAQSYVAIFPDEEE